MGLILGSGTPKPQYPYDQWYGVKLDLTSSDNVLTRVGNMDLHRTLPIQSKIRRFVENADGSVKYYLHQNDSRLKEGGASATLDTTDGNVMLEIPAHYLKVELNGTEYIRAVSEYPLPGFVLVPRRTIAPWFSTIDIANNKAVSGCFLTWDGDNIARSGGLPVFTANAANFRGGAGASDSAKDGTYNSQLGMGRASISKAGVRPYCLGGTHHGAYRAYNELAWLQRIEYANLDCQATYNATLTADGFHQGGLGNGIAWDGSEWNTWGDYKPFIPGGVTATLGNNTGVVQYTLVKSDSTTKVFNVASYRGFEVPFEYLWMLADDVLIWHKDNESVAYVCDDPTKFTSHSDNAAAAPVGYDAIATLPRTSGYIRKCSQEGAKGYCFPSEVTSSHVAYKDYFDTPASGATPGRGWFGALLSAAATYGADAGFGFLYTVRRSSYSDAYFGFRLCRN